MSEEKITPPINWSSVELGELILFAIGGDWGKEPNLDDSDFTLVYCIRGSEIRNWDENKGQSASLRKIKTASMEKRRLIEGDILVEISGGGPEQPVGRTVLIDKSTLLFKPDIPKICTNFLRLIRPSRNINSYFLNTFLKYFYNSGKIINYQAGSNNLRNLKFNHYIKINLPIPPFQEQHRIVAKIEELFSDLDQGITSLKKAQAQLKTYRQAVLKDAFEGKLTAQWREEHTSELETAEEVLQKIKSEREKLAREEMAQWKIDVQAWELAGKTGEKPTKPSHNIDILDPLINDELNILPDLPLSWGKYKFNEFIKSIESGKSFKCDERPPLQNEVGVIKVSSVSWGEFDPNESKTCKDKEKINPHYFVNENDFLFSRANTVELVGACVIVGNISKKLMLSDKILRFEFVLIDKRFCLYFLRSFWGRIQIERLATGNQASMKNIGQQRIKNIVFPLCSIKEQNQIVSEIESRFSICDKLEETIAENLKKADRMRQSILKKAFEGKLVPQDPNDEPASVLLERIKAEKVAYLAAEKSEKKSIPKRSQTKMSEKKKQVIDILKAAQGPVSAKEVWKNSVYADDIDAFYATTKKIKDQIKQEKHASETLLSLKS